MFSLVILTTAIVVASASKCCIPPQWEGMMSSLVAISDGNGKGAYATVYDVVGYDAVSHKIGIVEYLTVQGKTTEFDILLDYNTNSRYVINDGKCIRTKLPGTVADFTGCIPDNATEVGTEDVVGYGSNSGKVNTYAFYTPNFVNYVSVTSDACVPVVENARGSKNGNTFIQNNYYFNISAGLSDTTVANMASPPKGCENAPTVENHYTQSFIGKRDIFGFFGL